MDAMALEDNTEAAVSADANDAEADKVIEQFLTGNFVIYDVSRACRLNLARRAVRSSQTIYLKI